MKRFIGENKRLLNIHGKFFAKLVAFQVNTTVFHANTSKAASPGNAKLVKGCLPK